MLSCKVRICRYVEVKGKKLLFDTMIKESEKLTLKYRHGEKTPNIGDCVKNKRIIDKKSDEKSIILII